MLALLSAFALPAIVLSPGTYTLSELSLELKKQGVNLSVRADCAEECYALYLKSTTPSDLAGALRATGRLEVSGGGTQWEVKRSSADRDADRAALDRYFLAILSPPAAARTAAIRQFVSMLSLTRDQAQAEVRKNFQAAKANGDPAMIEAANVVGQLYDRQMTYAEVAIPTVLPAMGRRAVGPAQRIRIADRPDWFFPQGYRERVLPFDSPSLAFGSSPDIASAKVGWDPISSATVLRMTLGFSTGQDGLCLTYDAKTLRDASAGPPAPEAVLARDELAAYRRRSDATTKALSEGRMMAPGGTPAGLRRLSDALLRTAQGAGQNLVAYVSPLSDRVLDPGKDATLQSLVTKAARGEFDPAADRLAVAERTGDEGQGLGRRTDWRSVSASTVGNILVVRNETDYLDGIVEGPTALPKELRDARLAGKPVRATAVLAHVASLSLPGWTKSTTFGSAYLDYTNPLALFPFAAAAMASTKLTTLLGSAKGGDIPFNSLEADARRALLNGVTAAGERADRAEKTFEPIMTAELARLGRLTKSTLRVSKGEKGCRINLVSDANSMVLWSAWLENVSFGESR